MKIVHVTGYFPPHMGGMELRTQNQAESFAGRGHQVKVITSDIGCKAGRLPTQKNLQIKYLPAIEIAHTPIMPGLIFTLFALPNDSIIHLHVAQAFVAEITALVCKLRGLPYVAQVHLDVTASGPAGILLPLYKKIFLKPVLRGANAITVLTPDYKQIISRKYRIAANKITIIPNGTYFNPVKDLKRSLHRPVRLLFVGRLSVQKNIPLLLEAIKICSDRFDLNIQLNIVGDGEKKTEILAHLDRLRLQKLVKLSGPIPPVRLPDVYRRADILVFPSSAESFGTVIIEAMASGTAVIASDIPAVRNIIKNMSNGLLTIQDPYQLALAISRLIKDHSLRHRLVKQAVVDVRRYDWKNVTIQYENLYRRIFFNKTR